MGWFRRNWKTLAAVAVSVVVFAAVVAAAPLIIAALPVLAAAAAAAPLVATVTTLAVAGFASGAAGYVTQQLLDRKPITAKGVLVAGAVSGVVTVATAGLLTVAAPVVSRVLSPIVPRAFTALPQAVRTTTVNTAVGATLGGGTKVAVNAVTGRPLGEGVLDATATGALTGLVSPALTRATEAAIARGLAPTRSTLIELGHKRYQESLENPDAGLRAGAQQNYDHVKRLLAQVDENEAAIRAMRLDPDRVRLQILYSDTFKSPASVAAEAERLFPGDPLGKLKALLLHEEPALADFRATAREVGLPRLEANRVESGIRGHNGPATEGSFWGNMWKAHIENAAPHPGSAMVGKPYPASSRESALPTVLDRLDSGLKWDAATRTYTGGPVKFVGEGVSRGQTLQASFDSATTLAYNGTMKQLAELRALHPRVFEAPFVVKNQNEFGLTIAVRDRVTFNPEGTVATVSTPGGSVNVTTPAELWSALALGHPTVSGPSTTKGIEGALGSIR